MTIQTTVNTVFFLLKLHPHKIVFSYCQKMIIISVM